LGEGEDSRGIEGTKPLNSATEGEKDRAHRLGGSSSGGTEKKKLLRSTVGEISLTQGSGRGIGLRFSGSWKEKGIPLPLKKKKCGKKEA